MRYLNDYEEHMNEAVKLPFKEIGQIFVNAFSGKELKLKKVKSKLIDILGQFQEEIIKNIETVDKKDIDYMAKKVKDVMNTDIFSGLNLDSFFRGLKSLLVIKKNKKSVNKYFNDYLQHLEKRIGDMKKIKKDEYEEDEEMPFSKLKEIKKKIKFKIDRDTFLSELTSLKIELLKMEEWLKKSGKSLAICFDGRDAAGKGSTIKAIIADMDPKFITVSSFGIPTKEEQENWFQRYEERLPKPGHITLYDRSWYNRAVNDPAMGYCTKEQYEQFMKDVIPFEEKIVENDIYLIKFWFSISKEIQEHRFAMRQVNPLRYWKFSPNDLAAMSKWDKFTIYKERMFLETSTPKSPWIMVNSDDKRLAKLNSIRYILKKVPYEGKDLKVIGDIRSEIVIPMV